jgi:hypothetical protein
VSTPEPGVFAAEGAAAFNRLDVEAVLALFHDDVVFTSPVAAKVLAVQPGGLPATTGVADLDFGRYRTLAAPCSNEHHDASGGPNVVSPHRAGAVHVFQTCAIRLW